MPDPAHILITADGIADATINLGGATDSPAAILVDRGASGRRVLAVAPLDEVLTTHPQAQRARRIDRPGHVLIPGLVNAHCHLDLTIIGPQPRDPAAPFTDWLRAIRDRRPTDPATIAASVREGVGFCRRGGVCVVGDIAGAVRGAPSIAAARALHESGMAGVSFIEFFAIGTGEARRLAELRGLLGDPWRPSSGLRLGLQPHAPYSVSPAAYRAAAALAAAGGMPLMTHLAESVDEHEFIASAAGPQRELLRELGLWTDEINAEFGRGASPVAHLAAACPTARVAAVHVNGCSDVDLALLARLRWPVVYCPRASGYFDAPARFGPHRHRDMLDAGIPVAVGTDSIVNLPSGTDRLSTLDEVRLLHRRDGTDPQRLLAMATVHGAAALGLDPLLVSLVPGASPIGVLAVPVTPHGTGSSAARVLKSESAPEFLLE